jgi:hypothetical protein
MQFTSSFKLDTNKTLESPRNAPGLFEFNPDCANAKAPKLGIPLLYALMAVGVPRPIAVKGGKTPGAPPIPLTAAR